MEQPLVQILVVSKYPLLHISPHLCYDGEFIMCNCERSSQYEEVAIVATTLLGRQAQFGVRRRNFLVHGLQTRLRIIIPSRMHRKNTEIILKFSY